MIQTFQLPGSTTGAARRLLAAIAVAAALLPSQDLRAQAQAPAFNREVVVLDPAHGGADTGARISANLVEKDVTLQLAARLRSLLAARGFTVISTRDSTIPDDGGARATPLNQRAELANKAHAVACLVVHATGSGGGVHIGVSNLGSAMSAVRPGSQASGIVSWDRAQEAYVTQSVRLANEVGTALSRSNVPLALERVAMRPMDNLMCPAISIELAPQQQDGMEAVPVSNGEYQQQVAAAIAGALVLWRNQAQQPQNVPVPRPGSRLVPAVPLLDPARRIEPGA